MSGWRRAAKARRRADDTRPISWRWPSGPTRSCVVRGRRRGLKRLQREQDNVRAAFAWTQRQPDGIEHGLRLCIALVWYWFMQGDYGEARAWFASATARSEGAAVPPPAVLRARAADAAAWAAENQDDSEGAIALLETSLELYREAGDRAGLAEALVDLGRTLQRQGDVAQATRREEEALALYRELGHSWGIAFSLQFLE